MKIGILGATGAVGRQMLECIEERNMDVQEIRLFASPRSLGKKIPYHDGELSVEVVTQERLNGLDYVLGAVSNALSKQYRPMIEQAGAVYVDNSSAFRLEEGVPLVVPEINGEDALEHHGLIANPNCSTIISMMALAPLARISPITKLVASTYQAVSGAGIEGLYELERQMKDVAEGKETEHHVFRDQIACNVIAEIGSYTDNGFTTEEMKMQNEGRKILHMPEMKVDCTCVRVPVMRSHSISLQAVFEDHITVQQATEAIAAFNGDVMCETELPEPLFTSNQDLVHVGRIRPSLIEENGLVLWCCGDQIRKGAASNAVQIIEYLEAHR
ncbi:MAG: aspartate-semialdehyde dehydrogenase [Bulleidia sp.]